jgi:hypothetical protein
MWHIIVDGTSEDEHEFAGRMGVLESIKDHNSLPCFKTKLPPNILHLRSKAINPTQISFYLAN